MSLGLSRFVFGFGVFLGFVGLGFRAEASGEVRLLAPHFPLDVRALRAKQP